MDPFEAVSLDLDMAPDTQTPDFAKPEYDEFLGRIFGNKKNRNRKKGRPGASLIRPGARKPKRFGKKGGGGILSRRDMIRERYAESPGDKKQAYAFRKSMATVDFLLRRGFISKAQAEALADNIDAQLGDADEDNFIGSEYDHFFGKKAKRRRQLRKQYRDTGMSRSEARKKARQETGQTKVGAKLREVFNKAKTALEERAAEAGEDLGEATPTYTPDGADASIQVTTGGGSGAGLGAAPAATQQAGVFASIPKPVQYIGLGLIALGVLKAAKVI